MSSTNISRRTFERKGLSSLAVLLAALVPLFILCACGPASKQASVIQSNPQIFEKGYSQTEQEQITRGFKARPAQYSQQYGQFILSQMFQKSPEFAKEFAQTPELNDGINPAEARAMQHIYKLVSKVKIPKELLGQDFDMHHQGYEFVMTWIGNSKERKELNIQVGNTHHNPGANKITKFRPIQLKQDDVVEFNKGYGFLIVKGNIKNGDTEGVCFTISNPSDGNLLFFFNHNLFNIAISKIYSEKGVTLTKNLFGYDLGATLTIKPAKKESPFSATQRILSEMINAGSGEQRFSAPMQAMLWLCLDGKIEDPDNPLKGYASATDLLKDAWGTMEGPRWNDFETVTTRLNSPEWVHIWISGNLIKVLGDRGIVRTPREVFDEKKAFCLEAAELGAYSLNKTGQYNARLYWDMAWPKQDYAGPYALSGHTVGAYPLSNEDMYVFVDWRAGNVNMMHIVPEKEFHRRYIPRNE